MHTHSRWLTKTLAHNFNPIKQWDCFKAEAVVGLVVVLRQAYFSLLL